MAVCVARFMDPKEKTTITLGGETISYSRRRDYGRCDCVCSGYTGLHAALTLARCGAQVAVLEQNTIGWGASSRNGGMMTTGLKESMPAIVKRHGLDRGRAFWRWALASIDHVEATIRQEEIACDFLRSGHAYLAFKAAHMEEFATEVAWYADTLDYHEQWIVP